MAAVYCRRLMPQPPVEPGRLAILPLASTLNPPEEVRACVDALTRRLRAHGFEPRLLDLAEHTPDALLIVTGGTEHLALPIIERGAAPVLLIAHPERNSLPAALEILSRARQAGRRGCICLLNDSEDGFDALARQVRYRGVHARLREMRLGRIGRPSDWLVASTPDAATVAGVWGPHVIDVPMEDLRAALRRVEPVEAGRVRDSFISAAARVVGPDLRDLDLAAQVAVALRELAAGCRLDACSVRCFDLVLEERTTGCLALSWLLDEGVIAGCEGDVPATLTMMWMSAMTGGAAFMANPQDVDAEGNAVWLAHCTVARRMTSSYTLRSHFESSLGVGIEGIIDQGDATLARIGGADLRELFVSDGAVLGCGDHPRRCRTQVRVRLEADVRSLLTRPVGNHHVLARGRWAGQLREYHETFVA
jgi:L-fucose isomerase-like protein